LHWVSHSIAMAKVCIFLSKALEGFSVSWLMIAIDCVWNIQLFFLEAVIWLNTRFPTDNPN